jgi:hypothetical protein
LNPVFDALVDMKLGELARDVEASMCNIAINGAAGGVGSRLGLALGSRIISMTGLTEQGAAWLWGAIGGVAGYGVLTEANLNPCSRI